MPAARLNIHTDVSGGYPIIIAHPRRGETNANARWSADRHFAANSETRHGGAHQMVSGTHRRCALGGIERRPGSLSKQPSVSRRRPTARQGRCHRLVTSKCAFGELAGGGLRRFLLVRLTRESLRDSEIRPLVRLGVKWSQVAVGRAHIGSPVAMCCERIGSARPWPTDHRRPRAALMAPGAPDNPPPAHPRSWSPAEVAAVAACCVVNGFVNETRRNCRDGVALGVMPRPGESA